MIKLGLSEYLFHLLLDVYVEKKKFVYIDGDTPVHVLKIIQYLILFIRMVNLKTFEDKGVNRHF